MLKSYKYRIYPNQDQSIHLIRSMGCVRFLYNQALAERIEHYEKTGKGLSCFDQINTLPTLKNNNDWLKEANAQSLQMTLRNLDNAFTNFFRKRADFPKFKSKHYNHNSIQYPQFIKVDFKANSIQIPKCGKVFAVFDRKFVGIIKTCTVSRTPTNKFFISILVEDGKVIPEKAPVQQQTSIGIDLGIKHFAILSNGEKIANPKYLSKSLAKLKVLYRQLSRKVKGSKNRERARMKIAKLYEYISNQRKDFLHKLSSKIIAENQTIIIEDLNVSGMIQNRKLAQHIQDVGWGTFRQFLEYKAEWYGKNLLMIGRFDPSSKTCSSCGHIKKDLKLNEREWICSNCQVKHDRDINAAINIKKFGLIKSDTGKEFAQEPIEIPKKKKRKSKVSASSMDR